VGRIDGIRLKVERAKKHVFDMDAAIRSFCESKPYTIGAKPHSVPAIQRTTLYIASVKPIPGHIALIIGDAVHNLRSALDHLAWQLVEAGGGTPNPHTYFPIFYGSDGPHKYASAVGSGEIKKMPVGAEKLINSVQPYLTGDNTLWLINELDRVDKHRLVITVGSLLTAWQVSSGGMIIPFPQNPRPLVLDDEITNIPTSTYKGQKHDDFDLGIDIAFGEPEVAEGKSVLDTVNKMTDFVDGILPNFEPFLI
jgi:hypothetical protein